MQITTSRFGVLEADPETIITFTQPIIGFQEFRRFVLLPGPDGSPLNWLQSTDSSELAFLIIDPRLVFPDYTVKLSKHDMDELAASDAEGLEFYTLVVVPEDPKQIRTNLKAPIILNSAQRLAKQTVLERSDYPIQYFLAQGKSEEQKAAGGE
jgi:flagellar assembly factor FliW